MYHFRNTKAIEYLNYKNQNLELSFMEFNSITNILLWTVQ